MLKINRTLETMNICMPHIDNWKKLPKLCIKFNGFLCVEIQYEKTIVINELKANVEFFLINMLWRNYYRRYEWFVYELWRGWFLPFQWHKKFIEKLTYLINRHSEVFLGSWCSWEVQLLCNFIEIALRHGCSPVNLLHIFRTPFLKTPLCGCFLYLLFTKKRYLHFDKW